jgi:hypothetical protein
MKNLKKFESQNNSYWNDLPDKTKELIKELVLDAASNRGGPDCYKPDDECIEELEYESRDGFMPFSHNHGGIQYRNFTDLMGYFGGGYSVSHKGAAKEIERQIELSLNMASENTYEKFKSIFDRLAIKKENVTYSYLQDLTEEHPELEDTVQYIQDAEQECLCGDENSIMHEFRFMYHGKEDGKHSASVSAAVNTEGPYHRSHISWAPGVFCEGSKEVEITWKTQSELKKKLKAALAKVSKAVF